MVTRAAGYRLGYGLDGGLCIRAGACFRWSVRCAGVAGGAGYVDTDFRRGVLGLSREALRTGCPRPTLPIGTLQPKVCIPVSRRSKVAPDQRKHWIQTFGPLRIHPYPRSAARPGDTAADLHKHPTRSRAQVCIPQVSGGMPMIVTPIRCHPWRRPHASGGLVPRSASELPRARERRRRVRLAHRYR